MKWIKTKVNKTQGAAMVAVLCIMAVFIALSFSILLVASVSVSSSQKQLGVEKCRQIAVSFSEVVDQEITKYDASDETKDKSNLVNYIRNHMLTNTWSYYKKDSVMNANKKKATITFQAKTDIPDCNVYVEMYWEPPKEEETFSTGQESTYEGIQLTVKAICESKGQNYEKKQKYILSMTKRDVDITGGVKYIWKWEPYQTMN